MRASSIDGRVLASGERIPVDGPFKRGESSQHDVNFALPEIGHHGRDPSHPRDVTHAVFGWCLHIGNPVTVVSGYAEVRHVGGHIAQPGDEADAEIRNAVDSSASAFLRPFQMPKWRCE